MNEQISTIQTREVLELMRSLAPILNQKELFEFMLFSNRVLKRYMPEYYNDGLSEEVTEMRKDKAWLKEELMGLSIKARHKENNQREWHMGHEMALFDVNKLIDQLDEPEVLSQAWIDKNHFETENWAEDLYKSDGEPIDHTPHIKVIAVQDLQKQNLLVPKQDKPVIPQFVADYIEKWEHEGLPMYEWFVFGNNDVDYDVNKWLYNNTDEENRKREYLLIDAIRFGYKVEKEKRYYIVEKINNSTLMTFELSNVVGEEIIEFVDGFSENETIHFDSKEKAELIAHFVGESLEVEEVTQ